MKRVIILQGIPGSGKSHYAASLITKLSLDHDKTLSAAIVSADNFFVRLGNGTYKFDPTKLSDAHGECFREFMSAVTSGVNLVVVDNTNTTTMEISPYMLCATAYGYEAEVHTVCCEIALAAARNTHGVSLEGIKAMAERIADCKLPPWWKARLVAGDA